MNSSLLIKLSIALFVYCSLARPASAAVMDDVADAPDRRTTPESADRFEPPPRPVFGMAVSYLPFFPVAGYGDRYRISHGAGISFPLYVLSFWKISPEISARFCEVASRPSRFRSQSSIRLYQASAGFVLRQEIGRSPFLFFARVWDGPSYTDFEVRNAYNPLLGKYRVRNWLNSAGLGAGFTWAAYRNFSLSVEAGYGIVFTYGTLFQSMTMSLSAGCSI